MAIEVQNPGFASARRTPAMVSCILSRSWSPAFHEVEPRAVHRSRSGSLRSPLRPKPLKDPLGLDPVSRPLRSKPPGAFDQRAGPVRFEPRVSPDFRAAVSLGLLTFAPNAVDGKRPNPAGCAEPPRPRWTTLCISVGGWDSRKRISGLCCPQKAGLQPPSASRFASSSSHSSSAAASRVRARSALAVARSKALRSRA